MEDNSQNQAVNFPDRLLPLDESIEINSSQKLGSTADVYVQEIARKMEGYDSNINCTATGVDNNKTIITINTLGRWLFGVPGYQGNSRIVSEGNIVKIYYSKESLQLAVNFLGAIKSQMEIK